MSDTFDPLSKIKDLLDKVPKVEHVKLQGPDIDRNDLFEPGLLNPVAIIGMKQSLKNLASTHAQITLEIIEDNTSNGIMFKSPKQHLEYAHKLADRAVQEIIKKALKNDRS